MNHIHLDLHVNKHTIGTVIVSSLTVMVLAAYEYVQLNSALAYEKTAVVKHFQANKDILRYVDNGRKPDIYSDEVDLNSASEEETLPVQAQVEKLRMGKSLGNVLEKRGENKIVKKVKGLSIEERKIVLATIEKKISELYQSGLVDNRQFNKRLGQLHAAKTLFK